MWPRCNPLVEFHCWSTWQLVQLQINCRPDTIHLKSPNCHSSIRQVKKFNLSKTKMVHFYTAIIESILCSYMTARYPAATDKDKCRLQRIICSAGRGCNLPILQDVLASRTRKPSKKIVAPHTPNTDSLSPFNFSGGWGPSQPVYLIVNWVCYISCTVFICVVVQCLLCKVMFF